MEALGWKEVEKERERERENEKHAKLEQIECITRFLNEQPADYVVQRYGVVRILITPRTRQSEVSYDELLCLALVPSGYRE